MADSLWAPVTLLSTTESWTPESLSDVMSSSSATPESAEIPKNQEPEKRILGIVSPDSTVVYYSLSSTVSLHHVKG